MSKFDEIKEGAKKVATEAADKAKNYDYKGKTEELKEKVQNYDYKAKAEELKDKVQNYDYEGTVNSIKHNKSKIKKVLFAALAIVAVFLVLSIGINVRKSMSLTPKSAIENYFGSINEVSSVLDGEYGLDSEAAKIVINSIEYKIISLDEDDGHATANIEIKCIDFKKVVSDALGKASADEDNAEEIILDSLKKNKNTKITKTTNLELKKEGKRWVVTSDLEEIWIYSQMSFK